MTMWLPPQLAPGRASWLRPVLVCRSLTACARTSSDNVAQHRDAAWPGAVNVSPARRTKILLLRTSSNFSGDDKSMLYRPAYACDGVGRAQDRHRERNTLFQHRRPMERAAPTFMSKSWREIMALGFRLKFYRGGVVCEGRKIEHGSFLDAAASLRMFNGLIERCP
jgi:hypothetical protein